jgi:hypothetical protein
MGESCSMNCTMNLVLRVSGSERWVGLQISKSSLPNFITDDNLPEIYCLRGRKSSDG